MNRVEKGQRLSASSLRERIRNGGTIMLGTTIGKREPMLSMRMRFGTLRGGCASAAQRILPRFRALSLSIAGKENRRRSTSEKLRERGGTGT